MATGLGKVFGGVENALGIGAQGPPGVGGVSQHPERLVRQANGTYMDPTSGTSYLDAQGTQSVAAPNQSQLAAQANANSQHFLLNAGQDRAVQQNALAGQGGLAASYNNTINNPMASSVAQQQLYQGADDANRQQMGVASGAGGASALGAHRTAANNIAGTNVGMNQQAALLRAHEVSAAQQGLGSVYNNMGQQGTAMAGQDIGAGEGFAGQASNTGKGVDQGNLDQANQQRKDEIGFGQSAIKTGMAAFMG